jgi:hypothetical protein
MLTGPSLVFVRLLWSFFGNALNKTAVGDYPAIAAAAQKRMNHFHHPQYTSDDFNQFDTLEAQLQIGSKGVATVSYQRCQ